jgi:hypothetical protein
MSKGPGGEQVLDAPFGRIGAHDHHRYVPRGGIALEPPQHVFSRHAREMQVEQDEVGAMLLSELERKIAVHRRHELEIRSALEHSLDELEVGEVVLDVEDLARRPERSVTEGRVRAGMDRLCGVHGSFHQRELDEKGRPDPWLTFDRERSAHLLHEEP